VLLPHIVYAITALLTFFIISPALANDPPYPNSPPPHPRTQSPPTHPSNAHRRAPTTYLNCGFNDTKQKAEQSSDYPESAKKCRLIFTIRTRRTQVDEWLNWANGNVHKNEFTGESASWMRTAANAGHIRAQFELAHYLIHGTGIAIDFVEAQAWRIVAANQNPVTGNKIRYWLSNMNWLTADEAREAEIIGRRYEKEFSDLWKNPSVVIIHD